MPHTYYGAQVKKKLIMWESQANILDDLELDFRKSLIYSEMLANLTDF